MHLKGQASATFPASQGKNSIAILPFVDMSPQKEREYFCEGMIEELINRLCNISELRVPARTSVFSFKGKAEDIREIGRKLVVIMMKANSFYLLTGRSARDFIFDLRSETSYLKPL